MSSNSRSLLLSEFKPHYKAIEMKTTTPKGRQAEEPDRTEARNRWSLCGQLGFDKNTRFVDTNVIWGVDCLPCMHKGLYPQRCTSVTPELWSWRQEG